MYSLPSPPYSFGLKDIPTASGNYDDDQATIKGWASALFGTTEFSGFALANADDLPEVNPLRKLAQANVTVWTHSLSGGPVLAPDASKDAIGMILLLPKDRQSWTQWVVTNHLPPFMQEWFGVGEWYTGFFKGMTEGMTEQCRGGEVMSSAPSVVSTMDTQPTAILPNQKHWAVAQMEESCNGASGYHAAYLIATLFQGTDHSLIAVTTYAATHSDAANIAKRFTDLFHYFCDDPGLWAGTRGTISFCPD